MSSPINLEIVSIQRTVFSKAVDEIRAETPEGQITILPHHVPIITLISSGELVVRMGNELQYFALSGGFLEVRPNKVIVLVDEAQSAEEIDAQRAEAARQKAEEILSQEKRTDDVEFAGAKALLAKSLLELRVAGRRKSAHRGKPPLRGLQQ